MSFKPYNARSIAGNVHKVLTTGNAELLSKGAYDFIIQHLGFIAHYNLAGFVDVYGDTGKLAETLLTSEYGFDRRRNREWANQRATDPFFPRHTSPAYNQSVVETILAVCDVADAFVGKA